MEKAKEEYFKMSDLIKSQYGLAFLDRFTALWAQINQREHEEEFLFGFRACAHLMLEVLRSD